MSKLAKNIQVALVKSRVPQRPSTTFEVNPDAPDAHDNVQYQMVDVYRVSVAFAADYAMPEDTVDPAAHKSAVERRSRAIVDEVFGEFYAPLNDALRAAHMNDFHSVREIISKMLQEMQSVSGGKGCA